MSDKKEPPKPKPKGGKSPAWQYFSNTYTATSGKHKDEVVTKCLVPKGADICGMELKYCGSTTTLSNHLGLVHSEYMAKVCIFRKENCCTLSY